MSEYKELAEKLNEKPHIPRARRIKKNISLIEEILETGVTIKYLVEQLNENGFEIKLETFKTELGRERRKLKNKGNENTPNNLAKSPSENKATFQKKSDGFRLKDHQADNARLVKEALIQPSASDLKKIGCN